MTTSSNADEFDGDALFADIASLPPRDLVRVLVLGANNLTVEFRATYVPGSDEIDGRFLRTCREMNECQHFLLGILSRILHEQEVDRDLFKARLVELSRDADIANCLKRALTRALRGRSTSSG